MLEIGKEIEDLRDQKLSLDLLDVLLGRFELEFDKMMNPEDYLEPPADEDEE